MITKKISILNEPTAIARRMFAFAGDNRGITLQHLDLFRFKTQAKAPKKNLVLIHFDTRSGGRLAKELSFQGFKVIIESSGASKAYQTIRATRPDVVIIDTGFNPKEAISVYKALRYNGRASDIPIYFLGEPVDGIEQKLFLDSSELSKLSELI